MNFIEAVQKLKDREFRAITTKEYKDWWYVVSDSIFLYMLPNPELTYHRIDQRLNLTDALSNDWEEFIIEDEQRFIEDFQLAMREF